MDRSLNIGVVMVRFRYARQNIRVVIVRDGWSKSKRPRAKDFMDFMYCIRCNDIVVYGIKSSILLPGLSPSRNNHSRIGKTAADGIFFFIFFICPQANNNYCATVSGDLVEFCRRFTHFKQTNELA